jgi:uncharacterized membrane protein YccC
MTFTDWLFDPIVRELRSFSKRMGRIMADNLQPLLDRLDTQNTAIRAAVDGINALDATLEEVRDTLQHQLETGGVNEAANAALTAKLDEGDAALASMAQALIRAQEDDPNLPHPHPEPEPQP